MNHKYSFILQSSLKVGYSELLSVNSFKLMVTKIWAILFISATDNN